MTTSDAEYRERNLTVVEGFRANNGRMPNNAPLLLLTTKGARSGQTRINPLAYSRDGDRLVITASKGGNPKHPDWYHNVHTQ
jgi:deazaflavin-dependent oxidoreductase (nitroreductase family)